VSVDQRLERAFGAVPDLLDQTPICGQPSEGRDRNELAVPNEYGVRAHVGAASRTAPLKSTPRKRPICTGKSAN
jgi:hypothetical protein